MRIISDANNRQTPISSSKRFLSKEVNQTNVLFTFATRCTFRLPT
jgi:hypothetical protein